MKGLFEKAVLASFLLVLTAMTVQAFSGNDSPEVVTGSDPAVYFSRGTSFYQDGDYEQALFMFKVAALAGHAEAAIQVGLMYDFGLGVPRSFYEARRWYLKAAVKNNPQGLYLLGHMEEFGEGRIRDFSKAFHWYQKAANLGESNAQYSLGEFYHSGKFVRKSSDEAVRWLSLAAGQCHDQALGLLQDMVGTRGLQWDPAVCF